MKVDEPALQQCHYEQVQRMLLAAFISDLIGNPGQQVRFRMPQTLEDALQTEVTLHEAEAKKKGKKHSIRVQGSSVKNVTSMDTHGSNVSPISGRSKQDPRPPRASKPAECKVRI
jgi:hypothetical protein